MVHGIYWYVGGIQTWLYLVVSKIWLDHAGDGVMDEIHDHFHDIRVHACFKVTLCDEKLPSRVDLTPFNTIKTDGSNHLHTMVF